MAAAFSVERWPELDRDSLLAALGNPALSRACRMCRADYRSMQRAVDGLAIDTADRWAVNAGFHPSEIWPAWPDVLAEDRRRRYNARKARSERRRYRRSAARRAQAKANAVRWQSECRGYVLAQQRRRYAANRNAILERRRARTHASPTS